MRKPRAPNTTPVSPTASKGVITTTQKCAFEDFLQPETPPVGIASILSDILTPFVPTVWVPMTIKVESQHDRGFKKFLSKFAGKRQKNPKESLYILGEDQPSRYEAKIKCGKKNIAVGGTLLDLLVL